MLVDKKISNETECYKELGCAIVKQAADDYLEAKKVLYLEKKNYNPNEERISECRKMIRDCKQFFKSEWYSRLVPTIDGEYLIKQLDEEFEERKANNFEKKKKT